jgi:hypothetical protein
MSRPTEAQWNDSEWLSSRTRQVQSDSLSTCQRAVAKMRQVETLAEKEANEIQAQGHRLNAVEQRIGLTFRYIQVNSAKAKQIKSLQKITPQNVLLEKKVKALEEKILQEQARQRPVTTEQVARVRYESPYGQQSSTPMGLEQCDTERKIDASLDELSGGLSRIKLMVQQMNRDLTSQLANTDKTYEKTCVSDEKLVKTNRRMSKI